MPELQKNMSVGGLGVTIARTVQRSADGGSGAEIVVPPGAAGTLTTRTDNETGTLTMSDAGHGITTGKVIDLYWEGGARFGITVGTVSGTSVPIGADDSGTGDNLPAQSTPVVASIPTAFNAAIDGDELTLLACQMFYTNQLITAKSHVSFLDGADDEIAALDLAANEPRVFDVAIGDDNPFEGDPITDGLVSNGSTTEARFKLVWVQDVTP